MRRRAALRQSAGARVGRQGKLRVSEGAAYTWKAKFGGMDVSNAKRRKQLKEENAKLKKLLAEQMLGAGALRELLSKNGRAAFSANGKSAQC